MSLKNASKWRLILCTSLILLCNNFTFTSAADTAISAEKTASDTEQKKIDVNNYQTELATDPLGKLVLEDLKLNGFNIDEKSFFTRNIAPERIKEKNKEDGHTINVSMDRNKTVRWSNTDQPLTISISEFKKNAEIWVVILAQSDTAKRITVISKATAVQTNIWTTNIKDFGVRFLDKAQVCGEPCKIEAQGCFDEMVLEPTIPSAVKKLLLSIAKGKCGACLYGAFWEALAPATRKSK